MGERVTHKSVEFPHPFRLAGVDEVQPAGTYDVETVEEPIDGLSFLAYRRVSTTIGLHGSTAATVSTQYATIDPEDLASALVRDIGALNGRS